MTIHKICFHREIRAKNFVLKIAEQWCSSTLV